MSDASLLEAGAQRRRSARSLARIAAVVCACLLVSLLVFRSTHGAFASTTSNAGNTITAGTVNLTDDDAGSAMFSVSGVGPGDTMQHCITVTYTGTLASADIRMYGASGGTGLAQYLDTTIEVGTGGSFASCTGFSAQATLYTGTLATFATTDTDWASGLAAFSTSSSPASRTFRITLGVEDNNSAQGLTATPTFTWEAQNT